MREILNYYLNEIDLYFADLMCQIAGCDDTELYAAAALASNCISRGDICLDILETSGRKLSEIVDSHEDDSPDFELPPKKKWIDYLSKSSVVGKPGEFTPLVMDEKNRLYLYRYWNYENIISNRIEYFTNNSPRHFNPEILKDGLERLFPLTDGLPDMQRVAAFSSLRNKFSVISGGPGTGKTSTVVKIMVLFLEQAAYEKKDIKIAMCAPTGKAAARLAESVYSAIADIDTTDEIKAKVQTETQTIHRLLGSVNGSPYFRYNSENPLPHDVVIVDETSMADLALMAKLMQAVGDSSSLILLGDRDQLASVESGMVLGDICDTGNEHLFSSEFAAEIEAFTGFSLPHSSEELLTANSLTVLKKSYRFGSESGIGELSAAIRENNSARAMSILKSDDYPDVSLNTGIDYGKIGYFLETPVSDFIEDYISAESANDKFDALNEFRILCALKAGFSGVNKINETIERILYSKGLIKTGSTWYKSRPVMITQNDYNMNLYNGDIGIVMNPEKESSSLQVCFREPENKFRYVNPYKLRQCETVYSMTIHKSQGSEFDNILVVLPEKMNQLLTRELIYTAVTRARKKVVIWSREDVFHQCIRTTTKRKSGLRDSLWEL